MAIRGRFRVIPALLLLLASPAFAADRWQPAGPEGGNVTALAIDPANPRVLYAGVGAGGVFKSVDAGATWNPAFDGLAGNAVLALAQAPQAAGTLYAGTSHGVFKTTDGGALWAAASAGSSPAANGVVDALVVTPSAIYAGVSESFRRDRRPDFSRASMAESTGPSSISAATTGSGDGARRRSHEPSRPLRRDPGARPPLRDRRAPERRRRGDLVAPRAAGCRRGRSRTSRSIRRRRAPSTRRSGRRRLPQRRRRGPLAKREPRPDQSARHRAGLRAGARHPLRRRAAGDRRHRLAVPHHERRRALAAGGPRAPVRPPGGGGGSARVGALRRQRERRRLPQRDSGAAGPLPTAGFAPSPRTRWSPTPGGRGSSRRHPGLRADQDREWRGELECARRRRGGPQAAGDRSPAAGHGLCPRPGGKAAAEPERRPELADDLPAERLPAERRQPPRPRPERSFHPLRRPAPRDRPQRRRRRHLDAGADLHLLDPAFPAITPASRVFVGALSFCGPNNGRRRHPDARCTGGGGRSRSHVDCSSSQPRPPWPPIPGSRRPSTRGSAAFSIEPPANVSQIYRTTDGVTWSPVALPGESRSGHGLRLPAGGARRRLRRHPGAGDLRERKRRRDLAHRQRRTAQLLDLRAGGRRGLFHDLRRDGGRPLQAGPRHALAAAAAAHLDAAVGVLLADPGEEAPHPGLVAEPLDAVQLAGQGRVVEEGVDLAVAGRADLGPGAVAAVLLPVGIR